MGLYRSARKASLAIPIWGHHRPSWANCSTQSKAFENNYTLFHTTQRRSTLKLVSTSVSTALLRQPPSISRELSLELLIRPPAGGGRRLLHVPRRDRARGGRRRLGREHRGRLVPPRERRGRPSGPRPRPVPWCCRVAPTSPWVCRCRTAERAETPTAKPVHPPPCVVRVR